MPCGQTRMALVILGYLTPDFLPCNFRDSIGSFSYTVGSRTFVTIQNMKFIDESKGHTGTKVLVPFVSK
ncbi:hypothetical protein SAMN02745215_05426 [Desulfitobacterium chlororespirans DSM 11544]|uniref:Uncharacterized protein n=1 Tax=Desulfitobacterium chlororespirans DSM 11544 TaxID=1121395 RepID=A0A1M7V085_9FIRM|nr:hypothetical protein SAMN02745215_05426 [Desulfitobacterium chlororespirans DSM 11544]